ncbi:MAG TPA: MarR family transcriptional regulator [Balneola sp.]|jgi:MarR family 2-MHQ and catechol resistance regulon transcriptional repressor|nr:MarR family transcriptional regulator [Balneola sp.]MAO76626.1 MarR family transcriptional regulator [Balneola sp.]MBF65033.1 MarR family transcriptional regulator [Balneola sp.]HAH50121.1 MarR family transcriptional regulator [Balneola sp.]HAW80939.1 MarR family transcriptional regulator [Balneola sp.]|tara:strand:- start:9450 stop:9899 length:450 start_codon:yes stop_codon:yes gene_type:complete
MPTHFSGTKEQKATLNTFIKLMRATESLNQRLCRHLSEANLTVSQFGILEALLHLGAQNQKELGKKLLKSGGNITLVIDNLEKSGLVSRKKDQNDRRALIIELTVQGKSFIEDFFPKHLNKISEEFSILDDKEKAELGRLCKKIGMKEE